MDVLWSPWRYDYIKSNDEKAAGQTSGCVFCDLLNSPATDADKFILYRAGHNFVILNIYPYISGHILVVPYKHLADLDTVSKNSSDEMMDLAKHCQTILRDVYNPNGFNLGMNLGKAGGAGVAEHLHLHILPRWIGDVNFLTSIGETRNIPEALPTTYDKLKDRF